MLKCGIVLVCVLVAALHASAGDVVIPNHGKVVSFALLTNDTGFSNGHVELDQGVDYLMAIDVDAFFVATVGVPDFFNLKFCLSPQVAPSSLDDCTGTFLLTKGSSSRGSLAIENFFTGTSGFSKYYLSGFAVGDSVNNSGLVQYNVSAYFHEAVCHFNPATSLSDYYLVDSTRRVRECFSRVPFGYKSEIVPDTIQALRDLNKFYSFTDIARNSEGEWKLQVNLEEGLSTIMGKTYSSDYDFHCDVMDLYHRLFDAHTAYWAPEGYEVFFILFPFILGARLAADQTSMEFFVRNDLSEYSGYLGPLYDKLSGFNSSDYIGEVITAIDSEDPRTFLLKWSDGLGTYKDPAVRLNRLLDGEFNFASAASRRLSATDSVTLSFKSLGDVEFPWMAVLNPWLSTLNGINDIMTLNEPFSLSTARNGIQRLGRSGERAPVGESLKHERIPSPAEVFREEQSPPLSLSPSVAACGDWVNLLPMDREMTVWYSLSSKTMILRLSTFGPSSWSLFRSHFQTDVLDIAKDKQLEQLVIDLTDNGGGYISLMYEMLASLVADFNANPFTPYDERLGTDRTSRLSEGLISFYEADSMSFLETANDRSCLIDSTAWYTEGGTRTISLAEGGTMKSDLTERFYPYIYEGCYFDNGGHFFSKIIALTDGSCGSACSYFISRLQSDKKAEVVTYGGVRGFERKGSSGESASMNPSSDMLPDSSSFCGGMVLEWLFFEEDFNNASDEKAGRLPTSGWARFNCWENYPDGGETPREFLYWPGAEHLWNWDFTSPLTTPCDDPFKSVLAKFETFPDDLTGAPASLNVPDYKGWNTPCSSIKDEDDGGGSKAWTWWLAVGVAVVVIIVLISCVCCGACLWCVSKHKRRVIESMGLDGASLPSGLGGVISQQLHTAQAGIPQYEPLEEVEELVRSGDRLQMELQEAHDDIDNPDEIIYSADDVIPLDEEEEAHLEVDAELDIVDEEI